MKKIDEKKKLSSEWFQQLRDKICKELEKFEISGKKFKKKRWNRDEKGTNNLGGGEMSVLRGEIFEKAGVNISTVFGPISDELRGKIPGSKNTKNFWASGISVVIHPYSPKIPAIHISKTYIFLYKN